MASSRKLRKQIKKAPHDGRLHYALAQALLAEGVPGEATETLRVLLGTRPSDAALVLDCGRLAEGIEQLDVAEEAYRMATELDPLQPDAHGHLGMLLCRRGTLEKGIEALRIACNLIGDVPEAHLALAQKLMLLGDNKEAIDHIITALEIDPDNAEGLVLLGRACNALGEIAQAIISLKKALAIDPQNVEAQIALAMALINDGKPQEAVALLYELVKNNPDSTDLLVNLGVALRESEEYELSGRFLKKAIRMDPGKAAAHSNLGVTLEADNKLGAAIASYRTAVLLEPQSAVYKYNLALALQRKGNLVEAADVLQAAHTMAPNDVEIKTALEELFRELGFDESREQTPSVRQQSAAITGDLSMFPVPDLLDFLKVNRRTGTLVIQSSCGIGEIHLHDGKLIGASSTRVADLGQLLIARGAIDQAQLNEAISSQNDEIPHGLIGGILLHKGRVKPDELFQAIKDQIFNSIADMVQWEMGFFAFEPKDPQLMKGLDQVQLDIDMVLLDIMRVLDESNQTRSANRAR